MAGSIDNIEAVVRAAYERSPAQDGKSEEELATDGEMDWRIVAVYLEAGVADESG